MEAPRRPPFHVPRLETVLLLALVLVGGALWAYRSRGAPEREAAHAAPATAVAVLPFQNVTGDPAQDYFSQGVSDEVRSAVARVPGLRVTSRTSSFRYLGTTESAQAIGRALGVGSILEGTVQRAADRVRVTVSLVDAHADTQLWTQTFDRALEPDSLFSVEGQIARAVARALQVELAAAPRDLAGRPPTSLAAHDLYLLGLYHWNRRTGQDLLQAVRYFKAAAARDPNYAMAYAGLANTYVLLPLYARVPAAQAMPEARAAANAALALDSTLADAYAALAFVQTTYDWDWTGAEASFRHAIALNRSYATAFEWYGLLLDAVGRHDAARVQEQRALALDPQSVIINEVWGNHLMFVADYDGAARQLLHTLELEPDLPLALQFLSVTYLLGGRNREALQTLQHLAEVTGSDPEPWSRVVGAKSAAERAGAVRALAAMAAAGTLSPYNQAQYYALVGADDEALEALEEGFRTKDFLMFLVGTDPSFAGLRHDRRFTALLSRMGLRPSGSGS